MQSLKKTIYSDHIINSPGKINTVYAQSIKILVIFPKYIVEIKFSPLLKSFLVEPVDVNIEV